MSSRSWMSLMRRVCFLCGTAVLAAGLASAQSSPSSNPFTVTSSSTNLLASGESSSNPFQLASDDDLGGTPELPAHRQPVGPAEARATGQTADSIAPATSRSTSAAASTLPLATTIRTLPGAATLPPAPAYTSPSAWLYWPSTNSLATSSPAPLSRSAGAIAAPRAETRTSGR